jgi:CheY-like chemotaxis protein
MAVTVLLVEDDLQQSETVVSLFAETSPDTEVIAVSTLKEALAYDRSRIDAVLLDLGLPDSDGLPTLTAVLKRFAPVPVIVLTAVSDEGIAEQLALGADDYLAKAIMPPAAIRRVVRYASRRYAERMAAAERDAQNKAVAQLSQLALTNVSTAALLQTGCAMAGHVLGVPNAVFLERSADALHAKATPGGTAVPWPPLPIDGGSPPAEALRTNRSVRVDDVRTIGDSAVAAMFRELGAVGVAAVPVRAGLTVPDGALVVWRERRFDEQEVSFLAAIANTLAVAMQREQMERILDAVPDRILRFDRDLRVRYLNFAAKRGFPSAASGMPVDELPILSMHRARLRSGLERALGSGAAAERFDIDGIVDGPNRFDVCVVPLHSGEDRSAVVVMYDVTAAS